MKNQNLQQKVGSYKKVAKGFKKAHTNVNLLSTDFSKSLLMAIPAMGAVVVLPSTDAQAQTVHHKTNVGFNASLSSASAALNIQTNSGATVGAISFYGDTSGRLYLNGGTLHIEDADINFVKKLALGSRIDNAVFANNGGDLFVNPINQWDGTHYMAFKFGNNVGWARVTVNNCFNNLTCPVSIDEYAFVDVTTLDADQFFNAGEVLLPVELTAFRAQIVANAAQLFWATASEENNAGFEVQRSEDGKNFETLNFVEGHGTTYEAQEYLFDDKSIKENTTYYYRLKQIDFDGKFEYTDVVTAKLEGNANTSAFYPNPALDGLAKLNYNTTESGKVNVTVYNITGQAVAQLERAVESGSNVLDFDFSALSKGNYFVKLENGANRQYQKLVIE